MLSGGLQYILFEKNKEEAKFNNTETMIKMYEMEFHIVLYDWFPLKLKASKQS